LSEMAEFLYKTTDYWHAASEQCIVWNDPTINIQWPNIETHPVLNSKDASGTTFLEAKYFK